MMRFILAIVIVLVVSGNSHAEQNKEYWNEQLFNSVRYAENGNDIIVDIENIKTALKNGADVNWIGLSYGKQKSVLSKFIFLISLHKESWAEGGEAIRLLFKHGVKIQSTDSAILFWSVAHGWDEVTKLLLEKGVSAKSWPESIGTKLTPAEYAAKEGYNNLVTLLSEYGAKKPSERDGDALRFINIAAKEDGIAEMKKLLAKGVSINAKNKDGETALGVAVMSLPWYPEYYENISFLLEHGADPNQAFLCSTIEIHTPPLNAAVFNTSLAFSKKQDPTRSTLWAEMALKALLKHGAHVSGRDEWSLTPLHEAAKWNNIYAARLLLENGAKVIPKDNKGKTPLDYAESTEMIKLFKKHGAKEH